MRAAYTILAALILVAGTVSAKAEPFWQQHNVPRPPAQRQAAPPPTASHMAPQAQPVNPGSVPKQHLNGPGPHKGDWLRQNGTLTPAQQEKKLENDPLFRSLTPEKQQRLLDRLHVFNSMSPAKKQQVLNRMETYEHLSPQQQRQADSLYQRYRGLPPDQQGQVSQAFRQLHQMSPEQREQYFNSDEFRNSMNEEQRSLLRGMSELYPNPAK